MCVFVYQASEELLREHYWDLRSRPFFGGLVTYMSSGPVVAMVRLLDVMRTLFHAEVFAVACGVTPITDVL